MAGLTALEQALWALFEHTTASVEITDPEGRIEHTNPRFSELTGYTAEEAEGRTPAQLLRSDVHDPAFYEHMNRTVAAGQVWRGELIGRRKDGSHVHQLAKVVPVLDEHGTVVKHLTIKEPLQEIDNPLQLIDLGLGALREQLEARGMPPELTALLDDVRIGVDRISAVTRDLASFTRPDPHAARPRRGRVLIIDDDELVLRGLGRMLGREHEVVLAHGGDEGLRILADDRGFDVILCDLMMPTTDGPEVYAKLAERAPEQLPRLVFCSGGAFTPRAQAFLESVENEVLGKPMRRAELLEAIAKRL